jgi:PD-(D/E)XK endonuclease
VVGLRHPSWVPLFVMRVTQRKGDMATARAVATFTEMGFDVAIPLTESAAYDLVVDDGARLQRVQCKFAGGQQVDLRRIHSNSSGYVVKRAAANAYDWLYVLRGDGSEYLIKECLSGRRAVNLHPSHRLARLGAA